MTHRLIIAVFLLLCLAAFAAAETEVEICRRLAPKYGARTEVRLPDAARVDLLTDTEAIEVDYAKKWAEAIGQSLYYGLATGKKPAIILLTRDTNRDRKAIFRCTAVCQRYAIHLYIERLIETPRRHATDNRVPSGCPGNVCPTK